MPVARHVIVTGRVQGVFFRAWTKEEAGKLAIKGWARNRADGSVEIHMEGSEGAVDQMVQRLRSGPSHARVDDLTLDVTEPEDFSDFKIRH